MILFKQERDSDCLYRYDDISYSLLNLRCFYELIEKLCINLEGLRHYLAKIKYQNCDHKPNDWFTIKDFKIILVNEFTKHNLYNDIGKLQKGRKDFKQVQMDKELLENLCYKILSMKKNRSLQAVHKHSVNWDHTVSIIN